MKLEIGRVFLTPLFLGKDFCNPRVNQVLRASVKKKFSLVYLKFQTFPIFLRMDKQKIIYIYTLTSTVTTMVLGGRGNIYI